jgi:hypothetical protein
MSAADLKASGVAVLQKPSQWLNSGTATIAIGASSVAVADTSIGANSVVLVQYQGAAVDATLTSIVRVALNAGVGFSIVGNANATAAVSVMFMVVKY